MTTAIHSVLEFLKSSPATSLTGWIRHMRRQQGMSGRQLAAKLGVSAPRVSMLERDEISGAVTFKTMHKAAIALDCDFVYALVPRSTMANKPRFRINSALNEAQQKRAYEKEKKK